MFMSVEMLGVEAIVLIGIYLLMLVRDRMDWILVTVCLMACGILIYVLVQIVIHDNPDEDMK